MSVQRTTSLLEAQGSFSGPPSEALLSCGSDLQKSKPWKTESPPLQAPQKYSDMISISSMEATDRAAYLIRQLFQEHFPSFQHLSTDQEKMRLLVIISSLFHTVTNDFYSHAEGKKPTYIPLFIETLASYELFPKELVPRSLTLGKAQIDGVIRHYFEKYVPATVTLNGKERVTRLEWISFEGSEEFSKCIQEKKELLRDPKQPTRIVMTGFFGDPHGFTVVFDSLDGNVSVYLFDSMESDAISNQIKNLCASHLDDFNFHHFDGQIQTDNISCVAYALKFGKLSAFDKIFLKGIASESKLDFALSTPKVRVLSMNVVSPILYPFMQSPELSIKITDTFSDSHPRIAKMLNPVNGYVRKIEIGGEVRYANLYMREQLIKYHYTYMMRPLYQKMDEEKPIQINPHKTIVDRIPSSKTENEELQFEFE